ncbi:MAG TPA: 4-hydroxy-tetrahydrodipicolinate reductase [Candidatus Edwardsbacteria bacterium]|nr:4-hydroxy-tetrahydrodipicolinate reductase [Candidatus Edwardsbacteria bacterium]
MIQLILCGAAGRMGQALIEAVQENPAFKISAMVERRGHPKIGNSCVADTPPLVDDLLLAMNQGQVIIEFSTPDGTLANAKKAAIIKKPMVIGTTGLMEEHRDLFGELAREIPMVVSSNMSVGVNLLYSLVRTAARKLPRSFEAEIVESHHKWKKDAPSGTAKRLLDEIIQARGGVPVYERQTGSRARTANEIGVFSVRAGDIVGEHTVTFAGLGERLELVHRAHSRRVFAEGALLAAQFVLDAKPGLYDMQDVLGLKMKNE